MRMTFVEALLGYKHMTDEGINFRKSWQNLSSLAPPTVTFVSTAKAGNPFSSVTKAE